MAPKITGHVTNVQRQRQQVTVDALIDAARRGMIEHGVDVTMDDIAVLAGVGRRTAFRHFATRDDLLQAALTAVYADYVRSLPGYTGGDWLAWLTDLARVTHRVMARSGRLFWDLRTRHVPPRLVAADSANRQAFHRLFGATAATLWQAAGGDGSAPEPLRQAIAAHLSPLFTQAVLLDADGTAELAADMATDAITAAMRQLLS